MSNFGIGFGAFVDGFNKGWGLGDKIASGVRQGQQRKAMKQAKSDYDKTIADNVMQQAGQADPNQAFDAEGAAKNARKQMSFTDFLYQQKMPEIIDAMVQGGDIQGAEAMRKWAEDGKERKFMESFGKVLGNWSAGQSSGDYEPFAKSAVELLNNGGYGMKATGYEIIKDKDGNPAGLKFDLNDGKSNFAHTFSSIDEAAQFLAAQGSPSSRVKQWMQAQEAAQKVQAERVKSAIGLQKDVALEGVRQQGRERLEGIRRQGQERLEGIKHDNNLQLDASRARGGGKASQEDQYVMELLRSRGFGDDEVNQYIANKYLGGYRKGKSPEEFAQQLVGDLAKDPMMSGEGVEAIRERARALMEVAEQLYTRERRPAQAPGITAPRPNNLPLY